MWARRNGAGDSGAERRIVAVRRSNAERSLKRLKGNIDVRRKLRAHLFEIKINIFDLSLRKVLRQQTGPERSWIVEYRGPGEGPKALVADLQDVAVFSIVDKDRANDGMRPAPGIALAQLGELLDWNSRLHLIQKM